MTYISVIAVVGILLLHASGGIPQASVGGSLTIGFAFILAALAVGIYEAWANRRGVLGWIVNIVVAFVSIFVVAPIGGMIVAILMSDGSRSLAASGGARMGISLAVMMLVTVWAAWGGLWLVNRWRGGAPGSVGPA